MISCYFEGKHKAKGKGLRHAVVDIFILNDTEDQILLTKRAETMSTQPGKWVVPGGFVEHDERVIDTARREALEETGYLLRKELEFLGFEDDPERNDNDRQNIMFAFKAIVDKRIQDPDAEVAEVRWWSLDSLPAKEEIGFDHAQTIKKFILSKEGN